MPAIVWFRRDLRLRDNTALARAIDETGGALVPLFILDDALLAGADVAPARVQFMLDSLRDLDAQLKARGSRLIVRRGDTLSELLAVIKAAGAAALYFNKDYTPRARARDAAVSAELTRQGVAVHAFKDQVHFEERDLLTGSGTPYTVFTPYKRAWLARPRALPLPPSDQMLSAPAPAIHTLPIPSNADLGVTAPALTPTGGETRARALLSAWIDSGRIAHYDSARDILAADGTSKLSAHLRFGTISPRVCAQAAEEVKRNTPAAQAGCDTWISELIWREFYQQVLFNHPHADTGNFKRAYDALRWGSGSQTRDDELFAAWREGRTGYPVVDAAMRQLNSEAWMHNRARMIVASFFTKDLLLDWRRGERYFMQTLVDGDPAANNGGWQWAASTGTDAQPYFRVFNPGLQAARYDPDGAYVRRHVPEFAGGQYPSPIVDHAAQKEEILRRFKAVSR